MTVTGTAAETPDNTVTAQEEASGSQESRPQDRNVREKTDRFLRRNQHYITAGSFAVVIGLQTYNVVK